MKLGVIVMLIIECTNKDDLSTYSFLDNPVRKPYYNEDLTVVTFEGL